MCKLQLPRGGLSAFLAPTLLRTSIEYPSISLPRWRREKKPTAAPQRSTAQAHCTTEQDRTRPGTAHNNDNNNNKTRLPCPNGKVAVCRCRLLYAGSSHFSWPHLANPSDLPQALVGDRQTANQPARQPDERIGRQTRGRLRLSLSSKHFHQGATHPRHATTQGVPRPWSTRVTPAAGCWFFMLQSPSQVSSSSLACPVCPFLSRPAQSHPVQSSRAQSRSMFILSMCCQLQLQVP